MIKLVIVLSTLFSFNLVYSQSIELDNSFGRNGKIKIKKGYFHKIFYDLKDDFFYVAYSDNKKDNFSTQFHYYIDGVCK